MSKKLLVLSAFESSLRKTTADLMVATSSFQSFTEQRENGSVLSYQWHVKYMETIKLYVFL